MALLKSRSLTVSIYRDPKTVYEFVFNLENLLNGPARLFNQSNKLRVSGLLRLHKDRQK